MPSLKGVSENVIAGLIGVALIGLATLVASQVDEPVPLWALGPALVVGFMVGVAVGRFMRYGEELLGFQADLISEAILGLREIIAGELGVSFSEFIERGVLAPARFGLSLERGEEVRLSILELDGTGQCFSMVFESGHTFGRKENFSLPRASIAGHALETRELQWTNDVEADKRWMPHPLASRPYGSLASMPIIVGDEALAVLNVVSTEKGAFLKADLTYIELLGSFVGLAWAMKIAADRSNRLTSSAHSEEGGE